MVQEEWEWRNPAMLAPQTRHLGIPTNMATAGRRLRALMSAELAFLLSRSYGASYIKNFPSSSAHHLLKVMDPDGVKRLHCCVDQVCFHPMGNKKTFTVEERHFHHETMLMLGSQGHTCRMLWKKENKQALCFRKRKGSYNSKDMLLRLGQEVQP